MNKFSRWWKDNKEIFDLLFYNGMAAIATYYAIVNDNEKMFEAVGIAVVWWIADNHRLLK